MLHLLKYISVKSILGASVFCGVIVVNINLNVLDNVRSPIRDRCSAEYPEFSIVLDLWVTLTDGSLQVSDGTVYPPGASWESGGVVRGCPCTVKLCSMTDCDLLYDYLEFISANYLGKHPFYKHASKVITTYAHSERITYVAKGWKYVKEVVWHVWHNKSTEIIPTAVEIDISPITTGSSSDGNLYFNNPGNDSNDYVTTASYKSLTDILYFNTDNADKIVINDNQRLYNKDEPDDKHKKTGNGPVKEYINNAYEGDRIYLEVRKEEYPKELERGSDGFYIKRSYNKRDVVRQNKSQTYNTEFDLTYGMALQLGQLLVHIHSINGDVPIEKLMSLVPQCDFGGANDVETGPHIKYHNILYFSFEEILNMCFYIRNRPFLDAFLCTRNYWFIMRAMDIKWAVMERWSINFVILALLVHLVTVLVLNTVPHLQSLSNKYLTCSLLAQISRKSAIVINYSVITNKSVRRILHGSEY